MSNVKDRRRKHCLSKMPTRLQTIRANLLLGQVVKLIRGEGASEDDREENVGSNPACVLFQNEDSDIVFLPISHVGTWSRECVFALRKVSDDFIEESEILCRLRGPPRASGWQRRERAVNMLVEYRLAVILVEISRIKHCSKKAS